MAITARRHALSDRTRPSWKSHFGLATMETLLALAWTLLLGAVTRLLTGFYLYLLPLQYVISTALVAWLECPVSAHRTNPLAAFGLVEASTGGKTASQWQTLVRILLTPPFLLAAMSGFVPLFSGRRSLPELLSGTRIVPLDPALDPRSVESISRAESRIRVMVRSYTVFSLAIAALILLVPVRFDSILDQPRTVREDSGLIGNDDQLLAIYLDLSMKNPDRIEYHVRLASLYYRNGMKEDLRDELEEVRRLDPRHAILLLESELDYDFSCIFPEPDSLPDEVLQLLMAPAGDRYSTEDDTDSLQADPDSLALDFLPSLDSLMMIEEPPAIELEPVDSPTATDTLQDTLVIPETIPLPTEILPEAMPLDTGQDGEDTYEETTVDPTPDTEPPDAEPDNSSDSGMPE